jgi:hypothetical protein
MNDMKKPIMTLPCKMKLSDLENAESGYHCKSCQKTLVDFRSFDQEQLQATISKQSGQVCGIFHRDQFSYKTTAFPLSSATTSLGISLLGILGFVAPIVSSCDTPTTTGKNLSAHQKAFKNLKFPMHVSGKLTEENGELAIPSTKIELQQNGITIRTIQTDMNGHFDFVIQRGDLRNENFELIFGGAKFKKDTLHNQRISDFSAGKQLRLTLKAEAGQCTKTVSMTDYQTISNGYTVISGIDEGVAPFPPVELIPEAPEPPVLLGEPSIQQVEQPVPIEKERRIKRRRKKAEN